MFNIVLWCVAALIMSCSTQPKIAEHPQSNNHQIIAEIIDSNELNGYWHIEHFPERAPLVIAAPTDIRFNQQKLFKFGQPVERVQDQPRAPAVFYIHEVIQQSAKTKLIKFAYPPEGLRGTAVFNQKRGQWHLKKIELTES